MIKPLFALLVVALLSWGAAACGGATKGTVSGSQTLPNAVASDSTATTTASSARPTQHSPKNDTNNSVLDYGRAASATDKQAVTALVKRYYAAAAAGEGATACSLIQSSLANAVAEDYGQAPGPSYLRGGKTCQAVMSLLFKHDHHQLIAEVRTLDMTRVRVKGNIGLAVLGFRAMPEREISVSREGSVWKINALLDSQLP